MKLSDKPDDYKIVSYDDSYRDDAVRIIHESFKDTQDAIYDTRFLSMEGTTDIINKVVENVYGEFLPDVTSVLLYKDAPIGFAFANVTGGKFVEADTKAQLVKSMEDLTLPHKNVEATIYSKN